MTELDHKAALAWALSRGTDASSIALVRTAVSMNCDGSYPLDRGDFDRCERAMTLIPGLRDRLPMMASVNSYWAALVPQWENIRSARNKTEAIRKITRPLEKTDKSFIRISGTASMRIGIPK